ncbi:hypothetical protein QQF64_030707 [Cirrhinus molitorella]|uniref:Uncharacterized protein n=1 Tax=Cirrhinus molitorella TaxID=172907 RepID=A0ABR3N4B3_9TELE
MASTHAHTLVRITNNSAILPPPHPTSMQINPLRFSFNKTKFTMTCTSTSKRSMLPNLSPTFAGCCFSLQLMPHLAGVGFTLLSSA